MVVVTFLGGHVECECSIRGGEGVGVAALCTDGRSWTGTGPGTILPLRFEFELAAGETRAEIEAEVEAEVYLTRDLMQCDRRRGHREKRKRKDKRSEEGQQRK